MYTNTVEEMSARLDYIKEIEIYIKHIEKLPPDDRLKLLRLMLDRDKREYTYMVDKYLVDMEDCNGKR